MYKIPEDHVRYGTGVMMKHSHLHHVTNDYFSKNITDQTGHKHTNTRPCKVL